MLCQQVLSLDIEFHGFSYLIGCSSIQQGEILLQGIVACGDIQAIDALDTYIEAEAVLCIVHSYIELAFRSSF